MTFGKIRVLLGGGDHEVGEYYLLHKAQSNIAPASSDSKVAKRESTAA